MAGSLNVPDPAPSGASSPWATLRQLIARGRGAVAAAQAVEPAAAAVDQQPGAPGLFQPAAPRGHAELFTSERTGDWIRVGCQCAVGADHWHAARAD